MYKQVFKLHAESLKALAHPRRLEILNLLGSKSMSVGEIYSMLDLPQANVSQHLMVLRDAGIVKTERDGKKVFYRVTHENIIKACDLIREFLITKYRGSDLADEFSQNMQALLPLVRDPVCQMRISPKTAGFAHKHAGENYYFCASGCLKKFIKDPEQFL